MRRSFVAAIALGLGLVVSGSVLSQTPPPAKGNVDKLIDDVLNNRESRKASPTPAGPQEDKRKPSTASSMPRESDPIEATGVREAIRPCWMTPGIKNSPIVVITVRMNRDARPLQAFPRDKTAYDSDSNYRIAADAALRAIMNPRCQPWPLPPDKYEVWKTITFNFDPRNF